MQQGMSRHYITCRLQWKEGFIVGWLVGWCFTVLSEDVEVMINQSISQFNSNLAAREPDSRTAWIHDPDCYPHRPVMISYLDKILNLMVSGLTVGNNKQDGTANPRLISGTLNDLRRIGGDVVSANHRLLV